MGRGNILEARKKMRRLWKILSSINFNSNLKTFIIGIKPGRLRDLTS
jgi:hypothetical protein